MTSNYRGITWEESEAELKSFGNVRRGGRAVIRIELEVTDAYRFGRIMGELEEIISAQDRARAEAKVAAKAEADRAAAERRAALPLRKPKHVAALPAPPLQLTYRRGE